MDFGKMGGMSTATLSQRRKRRNREKVRGKTKGGGDQMSTATVAAKGTEGACNKQDGREHEEGREDGNMRGLL
jgi:hypothetical protein